LISSLKQRLLEEEIGTRLIESNRSSRQERFINSTWYQRKRKTRNT